MNKTEIFKDWSDFYNRPDKKVNGVSKEFAKANPEYEKENSTNVNCWNCKNCENCWNCKNCESCESCVSCESCWNCKNCESCESCVSCENCESCWNCKNCESCVSCENCESCWNCKNCENLNSETKTIIEKTMFETKIENIHQSVFNAANSKDALDMGKWHSCDTTHCRAGWVIHLAGEQGYALEKFYRSTLVAALKIYKNSSEIHVGVPKFFEKNEAALKDMEECANKEKELSK